MTLLTVVWDFNPNLISIGPLEIRWYSMMWVLTFAIGMWVFSRCVRQDGYPPKVFDSVFWFGFLSTIIGARLGHCLFYDPVYYMQHPIEIFYIRQGGLASHGAAVGLLLGLWMFSRKNRIPYIWSLDRIMLPVTLGGGLVRLGNLMNSEIYGGPTDLPWGFKFVRDSHWQNEIHRLLENQKLSLEEATRLVYEQVPFSHPTQIYEALCYFATFALIAWLFYRRDAGHRRPGLVFGVGLVGVFLSRFCIEFIKNVQESFEEVMLLNMGQWLSIPFIIAGIWFIVKALSGPAAVDFPQPHPDKRRVKPRADNLSNIKPAPKK